MSDQFVSLEGIVPVPTVDEDAEMMAILGRMRAEISPAAWRRAAEIAEAHGCSIERKPLRGGRHSIGAVVRNADDVVVFGGRYEAVPVTIAAHFGEAL